MATGLFAGRQRISNSSGLRIDGIYDSAAPVPGSVVSNEARQFLAGLRKIVHEAIEAAGGEMRILVAAE